MRTYFLNIAGAAIVAAAATLLGGQTVAQNVRIEVGKRAQAIPKICESVAPASIEGEAIDVSGLLREAKCKGAGDMLIEYTYVMKTSRREKDKKGRVKEETKTYEVYIPTLKRGASTRGILLVTSRNGVPVPPDELAKERERAGAGLEAEENKIARQPTAPPETGAERAVGLLPLGMYPSMRISRNIFGLKRSDAALVLQTFLRACEFKFRRREQAGGRETLVLDFRPHPGALLDDNEKYIAQLDGTIWIDAADRIVTRLAGWPLGVRRANAAVAAAPPAGEQPPAIYTEMMRLPEGVWLPVVVRLNGADYPKFFEGVNYDTTFTYGEYKRFLTETKDVELDAPKTPQTPPSRF